MSDIRFNPVDAPEIKSANEPAKLWRNWYRAPETCAVDFICTICRGITTIQPTEVAGACCRCFPSKDVAETWALSHRGTSEFIGAFPVGERT